MNRRHATLVHLSDTHLLGDGSLLHGRIDTWARTVAALSAAAHFSPDAVLVTGDIADRGQQVHARAARLFEHVEQELGCPVITLPGNHDPAGAIGGDFNRGRSASGPGPADTVHHVSGLRIISLDSHGFGTDEGWLTDEQLLWVAGLLATASARGTVIALHHPPVPAPLPALAGRGLAAPEKLAAVLAGSDVLGILCGHYHLPGMGSLGTIPVWVAPAVSYNHNLFAPDDTLQGLDTSWFSVIKAGDGHFFTTPVQVTTPAAVFTRTTTLPSREPVPV